MTKGMKGFGNMMTKAINSIDGVGWGRTGAGIGAGMGGAYGMFSDDTSILGGAFKGGIAGAGAGRLARFGSQFTSARGADSLAQFGRSGVKNEAETIGNYGGFGGPISKYRATAVGEF